MEVGKRFEILRIEKGFSNKKLAEILGVNNSYISHLKGQSKWTDDTISKVAKAFDVEESYFRNYNNVPEGVNEVLEPHDGYMRMPNTSVLIDTIKQQVSNEEKLIDNERRLISIIERLMADK